MLVLSIIWFIHTMRGRVKQMLQKKFTKDLKLGTYVADIGKSWFNHPWKTKSKVITTPQEIQELLDYGITEVYIDPEKNQPELDLTAVSTPKAAPAQPVATPPSKDTSKSAPQVLTEVEEELPKASKAYTKALDTSKALIAACRMNKKIEINIVKENINDLVESVSRNHDALIALINLRQFDDYTYTHSLNVSVLAISTGKAMGLSDDELQLLGLGCMFHDLGKTRIPAYILNKPGKLSDNEFEVMRNHAALGSKIIAEQKLQVDDLVYKIARHHHERMDGSGYPDKLKGTSIPSLVTICALSDVYDALTADRVYHKGRHPCDAMKLIYGLRDTHFPAEWVDRFVQSVGIYPPGTVVQLNTEQIAVVMDINQTALSSPQVKIVADKQGMLYSRGRLFDLADPKHSGEVKINSVISKNQAGFDPAFYFKSAK